MEHNEDKNLIPHNHDITESHESDPAVAALSSALRFSFMLLKIIMLLLVAIFLVSGIKTVSSDEQAIVLRFGEIRGTGENRILGPGPHLLFPFPIDEIVKIPVEKKINLSINSFWYYERPEDQLPEVIKSKPRPPEKLNPVVDGYCLTRSEKQTNASLSLDSIDYNIIHCKLQLIWQIAEPERFFKNVYVRDMKPGEIYYEVLNESVTPLLQSLAEDAVVATLVNYTIDEARLSDYRIALQIQQLLQEKLTKIQSGIKVVSVQLTEMKWPRQVDDAFLDSIKASQESFKTKREAQTYAENTLNETAGYVTESLYKSLHDPNVTDEQKESLWSQALGRTREILADAQGYRTKVVSDAKANADYLQQLLPEYKKRPQLVIQKLYQDAVEEALDSVNEKMIIQPTQNAKSKEIRIMLNRDPALKPKTNEQK